MKANRTRPAAKGLTARAADKYVLYQQSVQNPDFDVEFIEKLYRQRFGRRPLRLREDFCGTALLSAAWVRSDPGRRAVGVDLDDAVLSWGREHNLAPLGDDAERVRIARCDVLEAPVEPQDVVVALNFSYSVFRTRAVLGRYFARVRAALPSGGLFLLDCFGGWESQTVRSERRRIRGFTYEWEQSLFNPIDAHLVAHISFAFRDGSRLERAFTYDWRHWQLAELRDLLAEAGFGTVEVYWEGATPEGKGDGRFRRRVRVANDPRWNAYLAAYYDA